jgi:hypothetical protein
MWTKRERKQILESAIEPASRYVVIVSVLDARSLVGSSLSDALPEEDCSSRLVGIVGECDSSEVLERWE